MKYKKTRYSTALNDLYGKKYKEHIEVGREYWWCFPENSDVYKQTGKHWNKLKISCYRSRVYFYVLCDDTYYPECHFDENSILAETLEYAQIDPMKDLDWSSLKMSKEDLEKKYCFAADRTEVLNWDNSEESDIDESKIDYFDIVSGNVVKEK